MRGWVDSREALRVAWEFNRSIHIDLIRRLEHLDP